MENEIDLNVVLLHEEMIDKQRKLVTTSLTLIDVHDFARSSRTYGVTQCYIAHPSAALRKLARTLKGHWEEGFGATYNPKRKAALGVIEIVSTLDEVVASVERRSGKLPLLVATSAKPLPGALTYREFRQRLPTLARPAVLMFGTGWGMSEQLLARADIVLEPLYGPGEYNHLSVRSACAIILDRLMGRGHEG